METTKKETTKEVAKTTKTSAAKTKKIATKMSVYVEHNGLQINVSDVETSATEHYKALYQAEHGPLKTLKIYIKPEERIAYYVANGCGSDEYKVGI